jgi:hypothetical protein
MTKTEKQIIQQEIQLKDLSLKPPQFWSYKESQMNLSPVYF